MNHGLNVSLFWVLKMIKLNFIHCGFWEYYLAGSCNNNQVMWLTFLSKQKQKWKKTCTHLYFISLRDPRTPASALGTYCTIEEWKTCANKSSAPLWKPVIQLDSTIALVSHFGMSEHKTPKPLIYQQFFLYKSTSLLWHI